LRIVLEFISSGSYGKRRNPFYPLTARILGSNTGGAREAREDSLGTNHNHPTAALSPDGQASCYCTELMYRRIGGRDVLS